MSHWKGHSERHLKAVEDRELARAEHDYEKGLTKWFKWKRSALCYIKKNALYYIAGISLMRGVEPLMNGVDPISFIYHHMFIGNMILVTIALAIASLNYLLNNKRS